MYLLPLTLLSPGADADTLLSGMPGIDIVIGFSIANAGSSTATVNAYVNDGTNDIHLAKSAKIPVGGAIEIIQGKLVLDNNDNVYVSSDVAVDVWLSVLDNASA